MELGEGGMAGSKVTFGSLRASSLQLCHPVVGACDGTWERTEGADTAWAHVAE